MLTGRSAARPICAHFVDFARMSTPCYTARGRWGWVWTGISGAMSCAACGSGAASRSPPLFLIVSNSARIDPEDRVFGHRRYPLRPIVVTHEAADVAPRLAQVAEIVRLGASAVDLPALAAYLTAERGVRRLVCEGGAILNAHMLRRRSGG